MLASGLAGLLVGGCARPATLAVVMDDSSMEPTLTAHAEAPFVPVGRVERGAVVAFDYPFAYPGRPPRTLIARVVGLPGDRLELGPNRLVVNGEVVAEPYAKNRDRMAPQALTVPDDAYFVLGDDRANQRDSRWWGPLAAGKLRGVRVGD